MKNQKYAELLENIGLSGNEARVYIAALSLGPTTILKISKQANMKRSSLYYIIENLKKKNLVVEEVRGFKTLFVAQDPTKLKYVFDDHYKEFSSSLPELVSLYNTKGNEDVLRRYEGVDQIKSAYDDILSQLKPGDYYLALSNAERFYEQDPKHYTKFVEKRAKKKLKMRMLLEQTPLGEEQKKLQQNYDFEVRFLPKESTIPTSMVITPHVMMIQQTAAPFRAMTTNNPDFIETYKQMFDALWSRTGG